MPAGLKIVAHENTSTALHVVLPHLPAASGELSDNDLEAVAGGKAGQYPFGQGGSITINGQTIKLAAQAGLADNPVTGPKSTDGQEINLPPGKYKVSLKLASGAAQNREFELAADETWGLVAGRAGVPLPLRIY